MMALFLELKFMGGLGNQLFQYATARNLGIKKSIPYLLLNTESYNNNAVGRTFGLNKFRVKGSLIENGFIRKALREGTMINKFIAGTPLFNGIEESSLKLHDLSDKTRLITSLKGYWQSEYYFKDIRPVLLKELVPVDFPAFPAWQERKNTVAIHIRRTDYLVESGFGSLSKKYYYNAIEEMRNNIENPLFIFFSDDIDWCKEEFGNKDFIFCEEADWKKDHLQLFLISNCAHQIIANSSFSWWGAWLNANPDKLVIRPERPFIDASLMYESYYPVEWTSVEN